MSGLGKALSLSGNTFMERIAWETLPKIQKLTDSGKRRVDLFVCVKVKKMPEAVDRGLVAGVFTGLFAQLAGAAVERPRFGDFDSYKLDYDIHWPYTGEIISEMGAYAERRNTFSAGIFLYFYGFVNVETVAEYYLLAARIDV